MLIVMISLILFFLIILFLTFYFFYINLEKNLFSKNYLNEKEFIKKWKLESFYEQNNVLNIECKLNNQKFKYQIISKNKNTNKCLIIITNKQEIIANTLNFFQNSSYDSILIFNSFFNQKLINCELNFKTYKLILQKFCNNSKFNIADVYIDSNFNDLIYNEIKDNKDLNKFFIKKMEFNFEKNCKNLVFEKWKLFSNYNKILFLKILIFKIKKINGKIKKMSIDNKTKIIENINQIKE